jgi:hypothetical protein
MAHTSAAAGAIAQNCRYESHESLTGIKGGLIPGATLPEQEEGTDIQTGGKNKL